MIEQTEEIGGAGPVTFAELRARGLDYRLQDVLILLIGEALPAHARGQVTQEEKYALGYGDPCPCGERGMMPGEELSDDGEQCAECAAIEAAEGGA